MKLPLITLVLIAAIVRAENLPTHTMRENLHARIMQSSSPPIVTPPVPDHTAADVPVFLARMPNGSPTRDKPNEGPIVVLAPFVVSDTKRDRKLEAAVTRQTEHHSFSPSAGGTIYSNGRVRVGGWWSPTEGWSLLKVSW